MILHIATDSLIPNTSAKLAQCEQNDDLLQLAALKRNVIASGDLSLHLQGLLSFNNPVLHLRGEGWISQNDETTGMHETNLRLLFLLYSVSIFYFLIKDFEFYPVQITLFFCIDALSEILNYLGNASFQSVP